DVRDVGARAARARRDRTRHRALAAVPAGRRRRRRGRHGRVAAAARGDGMSRDHLRAGKAATPHYALEITPESAGWGFSGLRVLAVSPGTGRAFDTGAEEVVVVPLAGGCTVTVDGERFALDGRDGVFASVTDVMYVPRDARVEIASEAGGRFALPSARAV